MMKRLMVVLAVTVFMFSLSVSAVMAQDFCEGNFDYDKDVDGSDASTFKQDFGRSSILDPCPPDGPAPVEKTWQSPSYAVGDDGYYHMGVSWTGIRFTDNGNGTITDNLTGLIWLKNANCFAEETWNAALTACNTLSSGTCGLTDGSSLGDWRLPNIKELKSLIDYDYYNPPIYWLHPFTDVQSSLYWSSTTYANLTGYAWYVSMLDGSEYVLNKSNSLYCVWPVRGGHPY